MDTKSSTLVHRLLFQALLEMRDEAQSFKNKTVFHLADLFHNAVLQMETASHEGEASYDDVLQFLKNRAHEKGCDEWLQQRIAQIEARQHAKSAT
jgi:hypothetical protein